VLHYLTLPIEVSIYGSVHSVGQWYGDLFRSCLFVYRGC